MKRITAIALAAVLLASGCASNSTESSGYENSGGSDDGTGSSIALATAVSETDNAVTEPQVQDKPPSVQLMSETAELASCTVLTTCGYSWTYEANANEMATAIADSPTPQQLAESNMIKARICPEELSEKPYLRLSQGGKVTEMVCYKGEDTLYPDFTPEGVLDIPADIGEAVFSVTVTYPQGYCSYCFITEVKSTQDNSGSGDGSASVPPSSAQGSAAYNPDEEAPEGIGELTESLPEKTTAPLTPQETAEEISLSFDNEHGLYDCPATISRTSWSEGSAFNETKITVIRDTKQLSEFAAAAYSDSYDEDFFSEKALLIFTMEENSGSVSHKVLGMSHNYEIVVQRNVPEVGTCDMAEWLFVVEIPAAVANKNFSVAVKTENAMPSVEPLSKMYDIVLLERRRNTAWGVVDKATVYCMDGSVYFFDFSDSPTVDEREYIERIYQLIPDTEPIKTVDENDILVCYALSLSMNKDAEVLKGQKGCDMGQKTLYAVLDGWELITIRSEGDWDIRLMDEYAYKIIDVFDEINSQ